MSEMKYPIESLSVTQILDVGIRVARDNFSSLLVVTFFMAIPYSLVQQTVHFYAYENSMVDTRGESNVTNTPQLPPVSQEQQSLRNLDTLVSWFGHFVVTPLTSSALIFLSSSYFLGKPSTPFQALSILRYGWMSLVGAGILYTLIMGVGIALLIIPGIYWGFLYCLYQPLILFEDRTATDYFKRSSFLMNGNKITAAIISLAILVPIILISLAINKIPSPPLKIALRLVLNAGSSVVGSSIFMVFYYSCRCRNEHFDLAFLAKQSASESSPSNLAGESPQPSEIKDA